MKRLSVLYTVVSMHKLRRRILPARSAVRRRNKDWKTRLFTSLQLVAYFIRTADVSVSTVLLPQANSAGSMFMVASVCVSVRLSCSCLNFWKPWPRNSILRRYSYCILFLCSLMALDCQEMKDYLLTYLLTSSQCLGHVRISMSSGQGQGHGTKRPNERN